MSIYSSNLDEQIEAVSAATVRTLQEAGKLKQKGRPGEYEEMKKQARLLDEAAQVLGHIKAARDYFGWK